jgi:RES domain-containing protein
MIVFRLSKTKYSSDLSGKGAEKAGGRWNSKGNALLYTSQSRALCTTEIAVHTPLGIIPSDHSIISIHIPDNIQMLEIAPIDLSRDWKSYPHPHSTQSLGDKFLLENKFLVMKAPSAIVQGEFNYLINPGHPGFSKIKVLEIEPFTFDERLFK